MIGKTEPTWIFFSWAPSKEGAIEFSGYRNCFVLSYAYTEYFGGDI